MTYFRLVSFEMTWSAVALSPDTALFTQNKHA
jgi:hypothetical protein